MGTPNMRKRYQYKVYSQEGVFLDTWDDVANDPQFAVVINGGAVEMQIRLARKTEDFGEEMDVKFNNEVQVWCFDNDAPNGIKVFSGFISRYEPVNDGPMDYIAVYCLGYHSKLSDFIYENSQGETEITHNSKDPGKIAEDILNKAQALGLPISWNEDTLQKTGTVVSYTFNINTAMEALDQVLSLSPAGWYWYVDAEKKYHLHPKKEQATHIFTVGKEIFYIQPAKRVENVVNNILFIGGVPDGQSEALYRRYQRPASIQNYGLKTIKKTDQRIKLTETMDIVADSILDALEIPEIRTVIRVKDNDYDRDSGYDIESIKIGDTCKIRNYQDSFNSSKWDVMLWDVDFWDFNVRNLTEAVMQIVEIRYAPDFVELVVSSKIPDVSKRVEDINRNLVESIAKDAPANPTIGE